MDEARRQKPVEKACTRIAVFDLDGTLLDGQSGTLVLRYLLRHRLLSGKAGSKAAWWGVRYKLHLPYRQSEVREIIFEELRTLPSERIGQIMRDFHNEVMVPLYRKDGIAELRRRREAGEFTIIVSATFNAIAQAACAYLGADAALATLMERDEEGHFTGRVQGEVTAGPEKVRRVQAFADERFGEGAWEVVRAYGDHYTDLPLLEMARSCFAVDPGPTLRREAERRGWPQLMWK
ncbi:MAG: haloacid dehalogenase-like hydrolase [Coriobacteriia bacterium]|nr:haloacid dehalogenase-like hydrolase [Coriobacteriia bacterium]MBS5478079.1 haloacid dehalogenase-like hydrolase [Coriobacteriia bacterium]